MSRVLVKLRVADATYRDIRQRLMDAGEEGQRRIYPWHLNLDEVALELDIQSPELRGQPEEDHEPEPPCMSIEEAIEHERLHPTQPRRKRK